MSKHSSLILNEHLELKIELDKYRPIIKKFTFSSKKLNMLLSDQRTVFNHIGLGYKPLNKLKSIKDFFRNSVSKKQKSISCYCSSKIGHKSYVCNSRLSINHIRIESRVKSSIPSATKKVTQV